MFIVVSISQLIGWEGYQSVKQPVCVLSVMYYYCCQQLVLDLISEWVSSLLAAHGHISVPLTDTLIIDWHDWCEQCIVCVVECVWQTRVLHARRQREKYVSYFYYVTLSDVSACSTVDWTGSLCLVVSRGCSCIQQEAKLTLRLAHDCSACMKFSSCSLPNLWNPTRFSNLGVNQKCTCNFLLVINSNFGLSLTNFEMFTFKARKWLVFPPPPLFDAPTWRDPVRISGWNLPAKTRGMRLIYMLYGVGVGGLNWRVPAGLFTWNQHERVLSVLMQLFCAFHCKVCLSVWLDTDTSEALSNQLFTS